MLNTFRWIAAVALLSGPAWAGPTSQWIAIAANSAVDASSLRPSGPDVLVTVLRNYRETMTLGTHVASNTPMYPHRSAELEYIVSCSARKLDIQGWRLFSSTDGQGEVVWADRNFDRAGLGIPSNAEEQGVIAAACGRSVATR